jgi:dimethylargininase
MWIALTRDVPPSIAACELSHLARSPIDVERAALQHRDYELALERLGCRVERIAPEPAMPDSVFVEDTAVVLPGIAIITRPGAESRRGETRSMAEALGRYRDLVYIEEPGTLDGGDILSAGGTLYAGLSARTNEEGIRQLRRFAGDVEAVPLTKCLHLKSAVTEVADGTLLINPKWIERERFADFQLIEVDPSEEFAANALRLGARVLFPSEFPRTRERLERAGIEVHGVAAGELAKAEGGVTCCSVIVNV